MFFSSQKKVSTSYPRASARDASSVKFSRESVNFSKASVRISFLKTCGVAAEKSSRLSSVFSIFPSLFRILTVFLTGFPAQTAPQIYAFSFILSILSFFFLFQSIDLFQRFLKYLYYTFQYKQTPMVHQTQSPQ